MGQAQSAVYSSNLADNSAGSFTVANNSWIAQELVWEGYIVNGVMLTPNCILNSVQLQMNTASGNPGSFTVSIYTAGPSGPGTSLGTLTGSFNPANPGIYTYTTPGITLSPANAYFVVLDSATPSGQGAYNLDYTTSNNEVSSGWTINNVTGYLTIEDEYCVSADGLSWSSHIRQNTAQMAIYGTPVSPGLSVGGDGLGNVKIVWPNSGSYILEQSTNLSGTNWTASSYPVTGNTFTNVCLMPPAGKNLFFRLSR
jgi:hypothetical protein